MKRKRAAPVRWPWIVLAVVLVLPLLVAAALLGPVRAARIAWNAASGTMVDGLADKPTAHRLAVWHLEGDEAQLAAFAKGAEVKALGTTMILNGVRFTALLTSIPRPEATGSNVLEISFPGASLIAPYHHLRLQRPASRSMLDGHLTHWVAAHMGVPVLFEERVVLRVQGSDAGVFVVTEVADAGFEQRRGLPEADVAVLFAESDTASAAKCWSTSTSWVASGGRTSAAALAQAKSVSQLLQAQGMDMATQRDSLSKRIDADAFLRLFAAMQVTNASSAPLLVRSPRTGLLYPVWSTSGARSTEEPSSLYTAHDALALFMLQQPAWRLAYVEHVQRAIASLRADGQWKKDLRQAAEQLAPSVARDLSKRAPLPGSAGDLLPFNGDQWTSAVKELELNTEHHWDQLLRELAVVKADATVLGNTVQVTAQGPSIFRVLMEGDSLLEGPQVMGAFYETVGQGSEALHEVIILPRLAPDSLGQRLEAPQAPYAVTITLPVGNLRKATILPLP